MKRIVVFGTIILVGLFLAGCVSPYYGQYERDEEVTADSLLVPPMSIDDVIALTKDSVSEAVIISQIKATRSYFSLTTEDILTLKKSGVSEKVISAMIKTGEQPRYARRQRRYSYYPPYYYSPYYYGYPWHSSFYLGYGYYPYYYSGHGYYGGHYSGGHGYYGGHYLGGYGGHYSGGHFSGGHGGGHRSVGGHR
jgi:hypothetical protein